MGWGSPSLQRGAEKGREAALAVGLDEGGPAALGAIVAEDDGLVLVEQQRQGERVACRAPLRAQ